MFEWYFPILLLAAAGLGWKEKSDKAKIKTIFKNVGYGVGKKDHVEYPIYKYKQALVDSGDNIGTTYSFHVPLGLPASKMSRIEEDVKLFSDGLQKPVRISFDKLLHVHVYDREIPQYFEYKELPAPKARWTVPLGKSLEGLVWHNFDHTPHMTIAGTTRFGKTVLLRAMVTYLVEHQPDDVELYIIDLKGGLEFERYKCLKQVKAVASDPAEAYELLHGLMDQIDKDIMFFRKHHYSNITETGIKRRRFLIVDEAAQLASERWMPKAMKNVLDDCQYMLSDISRRAGALGYREIFCTQYPTADTLPRSVKQNADAKISFRLPSGYASDVAIDARGAEELPSDRKGRALFKTHEMKEMQTPMLTHEDMWQRLGKYQEPIILEGEVKDVIEPERVDLVQFG